MERVGVRGGSPSLNQTDFAPISLYGATTPGAIAAAPIWRTHQDNVPDPLESQV